ncbi:hypothetical protein K440DRAFT_189659 [Wilcoxina mikolae CBS 423.85]|nr:hypothetical protein K440DRAFT_189659 [Wilcoxina mikolae CBS 423.85]
MELKRRSIIPGIDVHKSIWRTESCVLKRVDEVSYPNLHRDFPFPASSRRKPQEHFMASPPTPDSSTSKLSPLTIPGSHICCAR